MVAKNIAGFLNLSTFESNQPIAQSWLIPLVEDHRWVCAWVRNKNLKNKNKSRVM